MVCSQFPNVLTSPKAETLAVCRLARISASVPWYSVLTFRPSHLRYRLPRRHDNTMYRQARCLVTTPQRTPGAPLADP